MLPRKRKTFKLSRKAVAIAIAEIVISAITGIFATMQK